MTIERKPNYNFTNEQMVCILNDYNNDVPIIKMEKQYNTSGRTINKIVLKLGGTLRRKQPKIRLTIAQKEEYKTHICRLKRKYNELGRKTLLT